MITFAVCDDDPLMIRELSARLSAYMNQRPSLDYRITEFADGTSLLGSGGNFDLIFLDIRMNCPDGMETARQLRRQGNRSLLIFVTVLREYVFDAFAVHAFDYLIKPLDNIRFTQVMDRALRALEQQPEKPLLIRQGNACQVIPPSQIVYCEVLGRKIYLHRRDGGTVVFYGRLHTLEQRLDSRFFRCHRSYLVNLDDIRECGSGLAVLSQGGQIPVSRLRERDLAQALLCRIRERDL